MGLAAPIKSGVKRLIAAMLYRLGLVRVLNAVANRLTLRAPQRGSAGGGRLRRRLARNLQILIYHRVNDEGDTHFPAVSPRDFARQMRYLKRSFAVLPLSDAVDRLHEGTLPENAISITFDDGYRDNFTEAFPVLHALELPATIFLATDAIGTGDVLWHDKAFTVFRRAVVDEGTVQLEGEARLRLRTREERLEAQRRVLAYLRGLGVEERLAKIAELAAALEVELEPRIDGLMLDWDEVRRMRDGGIEFGGHTKSHAILSRLSREACHEEISGCKEAIERETDAPVTTFAYPNGTPADFDDTTKAVLRETGFRCAVTTVFGTNEPGEDLFALRRGSPWENEISVFSLKLNWHKFAS